MISIAASVAAGIVISCVALAEPLIVEVKTGESLVAVRDKVRALPDEVRRRGVEVVLAPGEYCLPEGILLSSADSGVSESAPVVWKAATPGTVRIVGARQIPQSAFACVTNAALLSLLPKEGRGKVYVADLSEMFSQKIPPFSIRDAGGGNGYLPAPPSVFVDGRHGTLARWPNAGQWCAFSNRVDCGTKVSGPRYKGGAFVFSNPRLRRWDFSKGVWIGGYFTHDWASWAAPAVSWGTENGTNDVVRIDPEATVYYGVMRGTWGRRERRFRAFNIFEELDEDGEWWLDREKKLLYVVPRRGCIAEDTDIRIVASEAPLIAGNGVTNVHFDGLEFAYSHGNLADMKECEGVVFSECRFRCTSSGGVAVSGRRCGVVRCEIAQCGRFGISMNGGDRRTLVPSGNIVEGCRIHDIGVFQRTYAPGISLSGSSVGVTVRGNEIFDAPHSAVIYGGNDHLFESNDVHHVCLETGDAGAFYTGRDWTTQGNVLRFNYIHDLGSGTTNRKGADAAVSGTNVMGMYFDDCDCGDEVFGNKFCNVGRGIMIGGGRDHPVVSNTFIRCNLGISIDCRGLTWKQWNSLEHGGPSWMLEEKARKLDYTNGVWAARYPRLANIMNDHPREPLYNPVVGNTFIDCGEAIHVGAALECEKKGRAPGLVSRMAPIRGNTVVCTKDAKAASGLSSAGQGRNAECERPFGAGSNALKPRIRRLLDRALDHDVFPRPLKVKYDPADEELPEPVRIGKRLCEYMTAQPVAIRADEELVGWLPFDGSVESDLYRRTGHRTYGSLCMPQYYLKPKNRLAIFEWQHTCADFPKIVREGLVGIRREIVASREKWAGDKRRLDYLRGMDLALDGIEARAKNCAAACRRLAEEEQNVTRKATLLEMADRCDHVPMNPARTFDEGVQAVFFCYDFLSDAIGRLDQYLAPLYFADITAGRITRERAAERLQELFIFIDAHTPHASSNYDKGGECHMTVGGLASDGTDGWTDFSRLVVESCLSCDLKRPEMSFRWHPGTKREVLRFILDCERRDPNKRIAFDGDVPRVAAFEKRFGFPPELARDYCITGCNEPTFMGGFSCGGFHMNAARCIERIFSERRAAALSCRTWDEFAALFEQEFRRDLEEADAISKEFNALRARDCNVLSALFMAGCIERAESPTRGGASRLVPVIDLLGTPNLIDSLCIVRQFVFDERRCTMAELADALAADWKGHEKLHDEIRREGKFYGANDPFTNEIARFVHSVAGRFAEGRRDWFGMPLTFGNHTGYNDNSTKFGRLTGATPDGRHAGEFLSFGGGPAGGHGPDAATSVLLAAAQMDPMGAMCGTSILNLSIPESTVTDEGDFEKLVILVETYFRKGGLHLQLNHVSRETLIDAQKHPERYPDLRVRVSGFSGYFVRFKKTIQDEIIARTITTVR